jgi:hypothetical protein
MGGFVEIDQQADGPEPVILEEGDIVPDNTVTGIVLGLHTYGALSPARHFAVFWDLSWPWAGANMASLDAHLGAGLVFGPARIWAGLGTTTVVVNRMGSNELLHFPQPHLAVAAELPLSGPFALDLGAGGGVTPSAFHLLARAGVTGKNRRALGWSAGGEFTWTQGTHEDDGAGSQVTNRRLRAALWVGLAFGRSQPP